MRGTAGRWNVRPQQVLMHADSYPKSEGTDVDYRARILELSVTTCSSAPTFQKYGLDQEEHRFATTGCVLPRSDPSK